MIKTTKLEEIKEFVEQNENVFGSIINMRNGKKMLNILSNSSSVILHENEYILKEWEFQKVIQNGNVKIIINKDGIISTTIEEGE